jgi:cell fate (sporulation/competence/biofilm development) regulator YlbF (YheA/YmcA/DUF963 family)
VAFRSFFAKIDFPAAPHFPLASAAKICYTIVIEEDEETAMRNMEQLAREFGAALQLSPDYVRCVAAKEQNDADEALQGMMREIELVRMQYQHEAAKGEGADNAAMDGCNARFDALYQRIMQSPNMAEYQAAAAALDALLGRETGIITGCARGEDPETFEPGVSGCGGNCGGCGGRLK